MEDIEKQHDIKYRYKPFLAYLDKEALDIIEPMFSGVPTHREILKGQKHEHSL